MTLLLPFPELTTQILHWLNVVANFLTSHPCFCQTSAVAERNGWNVLLPLWIICQWYWQTLLADGKLMKPASKKRFRKSIPRFENIICHLKKPWKNSMNCGFHLHCSTPIQSAPRQPRYETAPITAFSKRNNHQNKKIYMYPAKQLNTGLLVDGAFIKK